MCGGRYVPRIEQSGFRIEFHLYRAMYQMERHKWTQDLQSQSWNILKYALPLPAVPRCPVNCFRKQLCEGTDIPCFVQAVRNTAPDNTYLVSDIPIGVKKRQTNRIENVLVKSWGKNKNEARMGCVDGWCQEADNWRRSDDAAGQETETGWYPSVDYAKKVSALKSCFQGSHLRLHIQ